MDTTYGTFYGISADTAYKHIAQYNGSKQSQYDYWRMDMSDFDEVYADSIGKVYKTEISEADNNTEQLIYYHKTNGNIWGIPYVFNGLTDIADDYQLFVYPNPSEDKFIIHSEQYQSVQFTLYDVLSKEVIKLQLTNPDTEVRRNNLNSGIYFWQITDGFRTLKTGKLILE